MAIEPNIHPEKGMNAIHMRSKRFQCAPKNEQCDVDFGMVVPYIFESDIVQAIAANCEHCESRIFFFLPGLDDLDSSDIRCQQDGATYYTVNNKFYILHERI